MKKKTRLEWIIIGYDRKNRTPAKEVTSKHHEEKKVGRCVHRFCIWTLNSNFKKPKNNANEFNNRKKKLGLSRIQNFPPLKNKFFSIATKKITYYQHLFLKILNLTWLLILLHQQEQEKQKNYKIPP